MAKEQPVQRERSMLDQLTDGLPIDKHELDEAWVAQPDIFWRVCDQLARANNARDQAKLDLNETIARMDRDLRESYVKREVKFTETSLGREVELEDTVVQARSTYQRAVHTAERWQGLKESYQQRSWALKDLTALHIANYYQTNSGGQDARTGKADDIRRRGGEERRER